VTLLGRVWVVAESARGGPGSATLELVSGARDLGKVVELFTWGDEAALAAAVDVLGAYGVTRIYSVGDIGPALPGPLVAAGMARLIGAGASPDVVLVGASCDGRDVAGRLSAKLDRPTITNVVGLKLAEHPGLVAEHTILGGTQTARSRFTGPGPGIFVIRDKTFEARPVAVSGVAASGVAASGVAASGVAASGVAASGVAASGVAASGVAASGVAASGVAVEVVPVEVARLGRTGAAQVVARHVETQEGPKLDEATVVVSGGRGLGSPERYALVEELAALLHGAPGATRAIVDAGWVPYSHQVGQTGKTVRPTLYIACGISGATQHLIGMKGARHVIAINTDRDAPIFGVADLGVVGDCGVVLPRLIESLRTRR
jgi:electron transfer flavoprotein alpha subunit